jgi:sugar-specific transcriptional regulator TrmB
MNEQSIDKLLKIGFSEYEAKAYMALLSKSPVSGYELAKISGVPRSMIYEVLGKLTSRGAAMTLRTGNVNKYAPFPAEEFLAQTQREHTELIESLKDELTHFANLPELEYVWNIEGNDNITAKALEMIGQASRQIYLALLPDSFPVLQEALAAAITRDVRVVIYTTEPLDLPGAQVMVAHVAEETLAQARGLGLILVVDGAEVLIGEWLTAVQAWASWTRSPLFVFLAEHHLRTDLYLPQILAELGEQALNLIHEEDRDLFARALESHLSG